MNNEGISNMKSVEFEQFNYSLAYNKLKYHPIIYYNDIIYELNYENCMIRPINSAIWYEIKEKFLPINLFLQSECSNFILKYIEHDAAPNGSEIGIYSDGCISINIYSLEKAIVNKESFNLAERLEMFSLFIEFCNYLTELYEINSPLFIETLITAITVEEKHEY